MGFMVLLLVEDGFDLFISMGYIFNVFVMGCFLVQVDLLQNGIL